MLCIRTIKIKDLISIIQIKIVKCSNFNNNKCLNSIRTCSKTPNNNSSNNRRNISNNRDSSSKLIITNNNNSNSRTFLKIISIITIWDITIIWTLDNSNNISRCITGSSTSNSSTCSRPSVLASDPGVLVALA